MSIIYVPWSKAGRFVSSADCYAAMVLADNATFLLAVNRMVAVCTQAADRSHYTIIISGCRFGRASASGPCDRGFDSHLWHDVFAHLGICGWSGIILSQFWLRGQLLYRRALPWSSS